MAAEIKPHGEMHGLARNQSDKREKKKREGIGQRVLPHPHKRIIREESYNTRLTAKQTICLFSIFLFFIAALFAPPHSSACTTITISTGEAVLLGGNEDSSPDNDAFLVMDTSGHLGVVYFATPWGHLPLVLMSGINEKGLAYHTNSIPEQKLSARPGKAAAREWPVTRMMKKSVSVREVLEKFATYNWGDSIDYQIHFSDPSGDAALIHPGTDGKMTYTRKSNTKNHFVSTNFNMAGLAHESWSSHRYRTADEMLSKKMHTSRSKKELMASVLEATHQNQFTIYSFIYDLRNLKIHLYWQRRFESPYLLDVKQELEKTTGVRKITLKDLVSLD